MFVKKIIDFDQSAGEADVLISDGQYEILCYAHPFENKNKRFSLISFMAKDVERIETREFKAEKSANGYYSYNMQGEIADIEKRIVKFGDIFIKLEDVIPKDIKTHDFIEFSVVRIDYIELYGGGETCGLPLFTVGTDVLGCPNRTEAGASPSLTNRQIYSAFAQINLI